MKDVVAKELQSKSDELATSKANQELLLVKNDELTRQLELARSGQYLPPPRPHPIMRPLSAQSALPDHSSCNLLDLQDNDVSSSMWAPTPRTYVYPPATAGFLEPQTTGSTIHRPSSTASRATNRSAKEISKAADGWWG